MREGRLLDEAVEFCRERGLEFYAVNRNYPEEKAGHDHFSRKLKADLFIDDRNLGGMMDWGIIYRIVRERISLKELVADCLAERPESERESKKRKGLLGRLFS